MTEISLKKSFIKNNLWVTIGQIIVYAKGIIVLPILIKSLGVSVYGGYSLLLTFSGFIAGISSFGVGYRYKRFIPSETDLGEKRLLFYTQFYFQLISLVFFWIIFIIVKDGFQYDFFRENIDFSVYLLCGVMLFDFLWTQATNYFRNTHRMNHYTLSSTIRPYLNIACIIFVIYYLKQTGINYLLLAAIATGIIMTIPYSFLMIKEIGFQLPKFNYKQITEDIRLGFPLMLTFVIDFVLSGSDRFIIAYYMSTTAVGHYNPAYTLGSLIVFIPKVCGVVLPPLLIHAYDRKDELVSNELINYTIKFFLIFVIPFVIGSFILSKPLLTLLANNEVAEAAWFVTPIVALGTLFYGLNIIFSEILFVQMKTKMIFYINVFAAVLNLVLNLILMHYFKNIIIAAATTLLSYLISFLIFYKNIQSTIKIKLDYLFIGKIITASAFMGLALYFAKSFSSNIGYTLGITFLSILFYLSLTILFRTFTKKEYAFIKGFLSNKK